MSSRQGLGLIQVLLASCLLVGLFLPLTQSFQSSIRTAQVSLDEVQAAHLAAELMDQLKGLAYTPGFLALPDMPVPKPGAPAGATWVETQDPQSQYHQVGDSLPGFPLPPGTPSSFATQGGSRLGKSLLPERSHAGHALDRARARLYLSPLPPGMTRGFRIQTPRLDRAGRISSNFKRLEVRVSWQKDFLGPGSRTREVRLTCLIGNPGELL